MLIYLRSYFARVYFNFLNIFIRVSRQIRVKMADSDVEIEDDGPNNLAISKELAKSLYDMAGEVQKEDLGEISIARYQHLLNDSVAHIIQEVLFENPLPFKLEDFQLITLHCIGSLKNVILISPTGRSFTN